MIDEAAIAVLPEHIQIKSFLVEDEAPVIDDWFYQMRCRRQNDAKKTENGLDPVYHSQFDLFADGALRVYTRSAERQATKRSEQFIYLIELNLRKILWGHNGINIRDGVDLSYALMIVRHALQHFLVHPEDASRLIPGLGLDSTLISYWQRMELAMDIRDPGLVIRRHLERMRSPAVRNNPEFYENTIRLDGKNVTIKCYDKIAQMKDRHKTPRKKIEVASDPITRLEVKLKRDKLTDITKLDPSDAPAVTEIAGKNRLTGFTWEQLKAIHRSYFSELKAVYHAAAEKGSRPEKSYAAVFAAIAREHDIPPASIYELLKSYGGKADSSCRRIRTDIEWFIGQGSELTREELLSDENYRNQPGLHVSGLNGCQFYVNYYGWSEILEGLPEVRRVYGDVVPPLFLNPANRPYLFWDVADFVAANLR
ncbi:MAG: hypothetical protein P1U87_20730 [Verrucomicrobiales bacterium]|nr:hypothetical protein [Verrucomicrobiales bacterium]MDF2378438.1 hypothetical protein [Verrucomicrobiales bacterium]